MIGTDSILENKDLILLAAAGEDGNLSTPMIVYLKEVMDCLNFHGYTGNADLTEIYNTVLASFNTFSVDYTYVAPTHVPLPRPTS